AGWVLFEDVFLWYSMRHSLREMRELAAHQIRVERARDVVEREVQQRTQELAAAHQQLMEAARRAGMAETATAVLHNVGNVLNSINVSTGLASEALRRSRVEQLSKAMQLIESNSADLARFFAEDPKGKQLPAFLKLLAVHLADERDEVLQELEYLDQRVGHVKAIVTAQQSYAGMSGVVETFEVAAALDDAVRLNSSSFERHGIEILRIHEELSNVQYDKQKLLQILVNLVKNAKDSLAACEAKRRTLTLRTYLRGDDRMFIEVGDNGVGIAPENLTRIFAHGFTTKKEGHGFGLHSCANSAAEMGGRLSVYSDGPGTGATFTLELPFTPAEVTV
ncbi:MAG TPA: ATP-binding protein, partial [Pirellulales bacterium]|nr:ATP-binding protein [Pirellulales bacterium]